MAGATDFAKMVPGFDFLQGLLKNAGAGLPSMAQWIAPTLNPEELEKRIEELRTVQFWLEQNARMLGATIQALEVQRMTLSTLKSMNLPMADLRKSMEMAMPAPAAAPEPEPEPAPPPAARKSAPRSSSSGKDLPPSAVGGTVDPMQWWGALTKQFTELAAGALKETTTEATKGLAEAMVKQSFDAAGATLKKVVAAPAKAAGRAAPRKRSGNR
jgi:hypothetical protein